MSAEPRTIIILEGPDGGGKSTLAQTHAKAIGAKYVHCGPLTGVRDGLARTYVEAMLPALLGYQSVVMDRCWTSEPIYGAVYRDGRDRLTTYRTRMLERVAMRCGATMVLCLPPLASCRDAFRKRKGLEYLESEHQLEKVHRAYDKRFRKGQLTGLFVEHFDYTTMTEVRFSRSVMQPHKIEWGSAGNIDASVVLVGDTLTGHKNHDSFYQWPFVSFGGDGCSSWLTERLAEHNIPESALLWVNSDDPYLVAIINDAPRAKVFALGVTAADKLKSLGIDAHQVMHPQHARRFNHNKRYELITYLKEALRVPA